MGIKTETWVAWIAGTFAIGISAVFLLMTFAYGQFQTKEAAKDQLSVLNARLDRIEKKIDLLRH